MILNLGCGGKVERDQPAVNVDIREVPGINVVHDLNEMPWPFDDGQFDKVQAEDILEHLDDLVAAVDEIWRVLEPGSLLWVRGPYYLGLNWCADPTHRRAFNEFSFDYLDPNLPIGQKLGYLTDRKFRVVQAEQDGQDVVFLLRKMEPGEWEEPERDFELE
jgi:SAM-dependent methyltransferase